MLGLLRGAACWVTKTSLKKEPEMRRATGRTSLEDGMTRAKALTWLHFFHRVAVH